MESYPLIYGSSSSSTQLYSGSYLSLPNLADSETYSGCSIANKGNGFLRSISDDRMQMEFSGGSETVNHGFALQNDDAMKRKANKGNGLLRSISDDRTEMEFSGGSETVNHGFAPQNDDAMKRKGGKKIRSPRYAFQTRSQVDILDDGYRWRKYGQKAVKNNKFPRSYYRCTHQGCKVKKQVQRLTKDEGVVVTTYEGVHSHPIEKSTDNFEHILNQMQIFTS